MCAKSAAEKMEMGDEYGRTDLEQVKSCLEEENTEKQCILMENGTRLVIWTDGSSFHKDMPLVAAAGAGIAFARRSKANTNFALNAQGGMTNQRGELEACAAVLMAFDCKLEVRLDNMWVKTGVEKMLIEKKKQLTFYSEHTSVWKAIWERLLQVPRDHVTLRHVPAHLGWSDVETGILSKEVWEGHRAADEQAKKGAKKSEPPQQMMSEYIRRGHVIQKAQLAAIHILEWRDHNLDIAPGGGGEGARQAKAKLLYQCKRTEVMDDGTLMSAKPRRKIDELKEDERTHLRDVWIENRNQKGFQSKLIPVRWPLQWEVTERKDTWSDHFLVATRAYLGTTQMLEMTKEQSEEHFERKTTSSTVAIDFEMAAATKISKARGQAMVRGMGVTDTRGKS